MIRSILFVKTVLILAIALLFACGRSEDPQGTGVKERGPGTEEVFIEGGGSYTDVSPSGMAMMLKNKDFHLVNVHIPYEGEIENTDLFIPYNEIDKHMDRLPGKDAKIVVYCRSGSMSASAAETLVKSGYTSVWHLRGGMNEWQHAGYQIMHDADREMHQEKESSMPHGGR